MIAWCVRKDCELEATLLPVVLLWPHRAAYKDRRPARIQIGLPFCPRCSRDMKVEDLVAAEAWQTIFAEFFRQRQQRPDMASARIEWIALEGHEALEFIRTIPAPQKGVVH